MPKITIDNKAIEVPEGTTVLQAAKAMGIDIPALCYLEGYKPPTSCLVCLVKINGQQRLLPSCATIAQEGMKVESETPEVHEARRTALELLLSDHLGDCLAPCQGTCPAGMNIPLMLRQIAAHDMQAAIRTVKRDIALPAILGRICPAPCEKACRRRQQDEAVAICILKRYAADIDLQSDTPYLPVCQPANGKKIAIVGAGPAGLAAAWHLLQYGYGCTIFDDHEQPGGMLRYAVEKERLPREIIDREIGLIEKLGAEFTPLTKVGRDISLQELESNFQAVVIAAGPIKDPSRNSFGLNVTAKGIAVNGKTLQSSREKIFVAGSAITPRARLAVRSLADGKAAAFAIDRYLSGLEAKCPPKPFSVHIGKLMSGEIEDFMTGINPAPRTTIEKDSPAGLDEQQARQEAQRCLHCDCRKPDTCKLRIYAEKYLAKTSRYKNQRRRFKHYLQHPKLIYEPGKCIDCGLCIQIASAAGEQLGLSFVGRGFNVRVAVPFNESLERGLQKVADECVKACPTAALSYKT